MGGCESGKKGGRVCVRVGERVGGCESGRKGGR